MRTVKLVASVFIEISGDYIAITIVIINNGNIWVCLV